MNIGDVIYRELLQETKEILDEQIRALLYSHEALHLAAKRLSMVEYDVSKITYDFNVEVNYD